MPTPPATPPTAWDDQLLRNPHAVADKRNRVQKMFAAIAPSYDLNNRVHSLGIDQLWRKKAVTLGDVELTDRVVDQGSRLFSNARETTFHFWPKLFDDLLGCSCSRHNRDVY